MAPTKRPKIEGSPSSGRGLSPADSSRARLLLITNDKRFSTGDFEVITSDRVRFRVPSYHLRSASTVFRDAMEMSTSATDGDGLSITLDDGLIETATVFRFFLTLVCDGEYWDGYYLPNTHLVIAFLKKWDCTVALRLLMKLAKHDAMQMYPLMSPLRAFAMAAIVGDVADTRDILRLCYFGKHDNVDVSDTPAGRLYCGDSLVTLPLYMYTDVPPEYTWALARAVEEEGPEIDDVPGITFETSFEMWLGLAQQHSRPTHEVDELQPLGP